MKQIHGIWFPENDTHFEKVMNADGTYQKDTFDYAMSYVKEPKIFYDIGAHVGLWSLMAHNSGFKMIHAFEPNPDTFECLKKNLKDKALLFNYGIGSAKTEMYQYCENEGNSGAIKLNDNEKGKKVKVQSLQPTYLHYFINDLQIGSHQTLIKIDTEGMEAVCVLGMDKIIYALRPVVCVEQKSNKDALDILQKMGMQVVKQVRGDYILTWK